MVRIHSPRPVATPGTPRALCGRGGTPPVPIGDRIGFKRVCRPVPDSEPKRVW